MRRSPLRQQNLKQRSAARVRGQRATASPHSQQATRGTWPTQRTWSRTTRSRAASERHAIDVEKRRRDDVKNALKKLQKKRAADAKKAEKKAAAEAKAAAEGPKKKSSMASAEADDQFEPHQYFANRCAAMQRQQLASEEGKAVSPWPHKFQTTHTPWEYVAHSVAWRWR